MPADIDPLSEAIGQLRAATLAVTKSNEAAWAAIDEMKRAHDKRVRELEAQVAELKTGKVVGLLLLGVTALGGGGAAAALQALIPFLHK